MISGLKLRNWRSHEQTTLHFRKGSHLILGPMGSGKTSLFDALCFALFGTWPALKSRRVGLEETILSRPSAAQAARVELELQLDGKNYSIERLVSRKGSEAFLRENGRLIDGPQPVRTNESIHKLLKTDYETFVRTVYSEQNRLEYFLNLQPRERKKQIDELLGIDRFENARNTCTQATNKLKSQRSELQSFLQGAGLEEARVQAENFEKELCEARNAAENARAAAAGARAVREQVSAMVVALEARERQARESEKRVAVLEQQIKSIDEQLAGLPCLAPGEVENRQKAALQERGRLQAAQRELQAASTETKTLQSALAELEQEVSNAPDPALAEKELEKAALAHGAAQEEREKRQSRLARADAVIAELRQAILTLGKEIAECPVCDSPLSKDKHASLFAQKRAALATQTNELEDARSALRQAKLQSDNASRALTDAQNKLAAARQAQKSVVKLGEARQRLESARHGVERLSKSFSEQEFESIEKELRDLERASQAQGLKAKREKSELELRQALESGEKIAPSENELRQARASLQKAEALLATAEAEGRHSTVMLCEKENALRKARERLASIEKRAGEAHKLEANIGLLQRFQGLLEETQAELRSELVDAVNEALASVFPAIYPYGDFSAVRLQAGEEDYAIQLRARDCAWTPIESASGGEKSCAALALRIAFASVLSPGISLLVLDEPTHNLDERAVQLLSGALREELPKLVEQVFIITHDEGLKESASAAVFRVERDKERGERSIVEHLEVLSQE